MFLENTAGFEHLCPGGRNFEIVAGHHFGVDGQYEGQHGDGHTVVLAVIFHVLEDVGEDPRLHLGPVRELLHGQQAAQFAEFDRVLVMAADDVRAGADDGAADQALALRRPFLDLEFDLDVIPSGVEAFDGLLDPLLMTGDTAEVPDDDTRRLAGNPPLPVTSTSGSEAQNKHRENQRDAGSEDCACHLFVMIEVDGCCEDS